MKTLPAAPFLQRHQLLVLQFLWSQRPLLVILHNLRQRSKQLSQRALAKSPARNLRQKQKMTVDDKAYLRWKAKSLEVVHSPHRPIVLKPLLSKRRLKGQRAKSSRPAIKVECDTLTLNFSLFRAFPYIHSEVILLAFLEKLKMPSAAKLAVGADAASETAGEIQPISEEEQEQDYEDRPTVIKVVY